MPKIIFLLFLLFSTAAAQPVLKKEQIKDNSYSLQISLENSDYRIINKNGKDYITFDGFIDEQKSGQPALPSASIFIAIPYGQNPQVTYTNIAVKKINAQPLINPQIKIINNKTEYAEYLGVPKPSSSFKDIELKGFLWIGKNYCAHINVNEYRYNINEGGITKIESFSVEFKFLQALPQKTSSELQKRNANGGIIINPDYGSAWESRPVYKTENPDEWIDYNKTYLKIGTAADGIYRVYPEDLTAYGINISFIDPRRFKLINKGIEQPVFISGEEDGSFDSGDYIEFVGRRNMGGKHRETSAEGEPYNEYIGRYTDTTVYWLSWEGEYGQRAELKNSSQAPVLGELNFYTEVIHKEINRVFDFSMQDEIEKAAPFWHNAKTWNEGTLSTGGKSVEYILTDVYPNGQAKIFSKMQDLASNFYTNAHLLGMSLNSDTTVYDKKYIDKYKQTVLAGTLNSSLLMNGSNILKIYNYNIPGNYINACAFDWSEIEYPRYIKAISDSLILGFPYINQPGIYKFTIDNFGASELSFWKYNSANNKYIKYNITSAGGKVEAADSVSPDDKFVIIRNSGILKPKIYYSKKMKNLRSSSNSAEYIAVTHPKFEEITGQYASFISETYGLTSIVIIIEDIYDEFSHGYFNPEAIKDFLISAYTKWNPAKPEYICLIGSASYDYYGYKNSESANNSVPSYGAPVSDNWFVIWDTTGASYPQLKIGRLPVRTTEELSRYFEKHQKYAAQDYTDWNKRYILFSGGRSNLPDELALFNSVNDSLIRDYISARPTGGNYTHFYKTIDPPTNYGPYSDETFNKIIQDGAIIISYLGHSGAYLWDNGISSPAQLKNNIERYPLMTDFGCSTAKFAEPDVISFAEMFTLGTDGQAIQFLGNTSLGVTSTATLFPKIFYKKMLSEFILNSSEALNISKIEMLKTYGELGTYKLFAYTNTVIGDPVINIKIPEKPNLRAAPENISIEPASPKNSDDSILARIKYYNSGSSPIDTVLIRADYFNNGVIEKVFEFSKVLPLYDDSLMFYLPINGTAGEREIRITLDDRADIDELNETDNIAAFPFYIASSYLQSDLRYDNEQAVSGKIRIYNPSIRPVSEMIEYEISGNPDFTEAQKYLKKFDTLFTDINVGALPPGRYWLRAKIQGEAGHSINKSFYLGTADGFFLNDSISFSFAELNDAHFSNGIIIDTPFTSGSIITPQIGPAGSWNILKAEVENYSGSMNIIPVVYYENGLTDTLPKLELTNEPYNLSAYNGKNYKALKFIINLNAGEDGISPVLKSLRVEYVKPSELYMNYQTALLIPDTMVQGGYVNLSAFLYNAGESNADSVMVRIDVFNNENEIEETRLENLDLIKAGEKKEIKYSYYAGKTSGEKRIRIAVDPGKKIMEIIEDNNIYNTFFEIKPDTSRSAVKIKFDGKEIYNNEYVSSEPEIIIELYDYSFMEIIDTSWMNIYLDGKRINYFGNDRLSVFYDMKNPKAAVRLFPLLQEGSHSINITAKNSAGKYVAPENSNKNFTILKRLKLLDVYNYPNPASNETYFTFKLTRLPDILKIKIYTVAGRMVKEIKIDKSRLSIDFNKIYWDCKDDDGDKVGSGVYLYKIISIEKGESYTALGKIGIIR